MAHYIIQIIFFQLFFLLVYEIFLKKETFFNYNRLYLLLTPILAFLIPWLRLEFLVAAVPENARIIIPQAIASQPDIYRETLPIVTIYGESGLQLNWWLIIYLTGFAASMFLFIKKYKNLNKLFSFKQIIKEDNFRIIEVPNSNAAYTFFSTVFLGDQLSDSEKQHILSHEMVHVRQKHSLDLIFFELLKVIFWFNPLIYIYQNRIAGLHEFIADEEVVKTTERKTYYEQLLNTAFSTQNISFINQFFNHSLIKKRIFMLQKNKSSKLSKFKFLLTIPLMLAMLMYVACSDVETKDETDSSLSQYNYSLQKGEDLDSDPDKKKTHQAFEDFLINNPDYVSWATIDYESDMVSYSVHKASEEVPESYNKMMVSMKDGREYTMYMNLKSTGSNTSANKKRYDQKKSTEWDDKENIPYAVIERVPAFEGCEQQEGKLRKECTSKQISLFVNKNFNTDLGKQLGLTGVNRVIVQFRIDETGAIVDIKARAAHPELEAEAKRVISLIPNMIPGEQKGRPVSVMYSLPIAFKVAG
ncbi:M56 family metallopeptidase [Gramella sp. MAR_2010_147]|uniref:M56 family metallopeptidase n=1 Tax=Gramella sp. MAR_2010_147 TaxID=1250205 RepID=UPI00087B5925|nr:M56 family metallopeptidase [Gramella sp. MAR_2010_147]SDS20864.1 Signal transducer regulating beta-lactamase production, contains metallopeptidase domain [Gramella sp. MAR_2010_147]